MTFSSVTASPGSITCDLASESLLRCGTLRLKVTGWSMLPTIWPGDTLLVSRTRPDELVKGEIALFRRGNRMVAHRIIGNNNGAHWRELLTQGDALADADAPISAGDLLGRVEFILRDGSPGIRSQRLTVEERVLTTLTRKSAVMARGIVRLHRCYKSLQQSARRVRAHLCRH
ncbi:MAG: S24/S26 family peptidase [Candidatus Sulfotelmatobacter sp.]